MLAEDMASSLLKRPDPKNPVTVTVRDATHDRVERVAKLMSAVEGRRVASGEIYDRAASNSMEQLLVELGLTEFPDEKSDPKGFAAVVERLKSKTGP